MMNSQGLNKWLDKLQPTWSVLLCLLVGMSIIGSLIVARFVPVRGGLFDQFNPFLVEMVSSVWHCVPIDHRRILLAHKAFLAIVCLLVLFVSCLSTAHNCSMDKLRNQKWLHQSMLLVLLAFFWWSFGNFQGQPSELVGGLYCLLSFVGLVIYLGRECAPLTVSLAAALIAGACLPALFLAPDFSPMNPIEVVQLQQHYAVCFSFADQMAAGILPAASWLLHYGVLGPLFLGSLEKIFGVLSFRSLVQLVMVSQVVFLGGLLGALLYFARRLRWIAFLSLATVIPWYHCNQQGILYPNHSGLRLLAIVIGLGLVCALRRLQLRKMALVMGFTGGCAVLYNFETGLTLLLGFSVSLFLRRNLVASGFFRPLASVGGYLLGGIAIALFLFCVYFFVVTGALPYLLNPVKLSAYFSAPQMITMPGIPAGIAVLMFFQACYVLLATANQPSVKVTFNQSLKAGIALMLLVWEMYYFNRPYYSNLASCWALYSFLLIDSLRVLRLGVLGRSRFLPGALLTAAALLVVIGPYALMSYREGAVSYGQIVERLCFYRDQKDWRESHSVAVSGVRVSKDFGRYLLIKAEELKQVASQSIRGSRPSLRYVSIYSLLMPKLSGVQQDFPYIDPYFGVNLVKQYRQYLLELEKGMPAIILVDRPELDPSLKDQAWYRNFIADIEIHLSRDYEIAAKAQCWKIWRTKKIVH